MIHSARQHAAHQTATIEEFHARNAVVVDPRATTEAVADALAGDEGLVEWIVNLAAADRLGGAEAPPGDLVAAIDTLGRSPVQGLLVAAAFGVLVPDHAPATSRPIAVGAPMEQEPDRHAVAVAVAAALVAPLFDIPPLDAFTAGLLHDVGEQIIARARPTVYPDLRAGFSSHDEQIRMEKDAFGTDHALVGAEYLLDWRVPDHIVDAVADHPDPFAESPALTLVVAAADELLEGLVTRTAALNLLGVDPVEAHGWRRRITEETGRLGL